MVLRKNSSFLFYLHIEKMLESYVSGLNYQIPMPKDFDIKEMEYPFRNYTTINIKNKKVEEFLSNIIPRQRNQFLKQLLRSCLPREVLTAYLISPYKESFKKMARTEVEENDNELLEVKQKQALAPKIEKNPIIKTEIETKIETEIPVKHEINIETKELIEIKNETVTGYDQQAEKPNLAVKSEQNVIEDEIEDSFVSEEEGFDLFATMGSLMNSI